MTPIVHRLALPLVLVAVLGVTGCSTWNRWFGDYDPTKGWSAAKLYNEAHSELLKGNYDEAVNLFETLQARYPFGRYAQQAELEIAYAYYKNEEWDAAIAAADRFLKLHPQNPHTDYAWYLKGLANFNRGRTFLTPFLGRDPATKDPTPLQQAFEDFGHLLRLYPDSRYAADARKRMIFLRNELAEHEMHVADFYMRRGAWVAAANRGKYVLENYQGAPAVADALVVMVQAYRKLQLDQPAADALEVLRANFPERVRDLERHERSWWRRLFL
ncbi:MAG TPA: outer membrane protein assembly factor BamD [Chromatiales bacterium]|nr:outer membrane protein assembly factor BamD [Chromatiales bacterium]